MTADYNAPHIGLVVEGHGDGHAVPVLLRKHLNSRDDYREILGSPVVCNGHQNATRPGGIEGKVAVAAARPGCVAVLIVLDGEGNAVCRLGPQLLTRSATITEKPCFVALADSMFESWIVSSAETMQLPGLAYKPDRSPVSLLQEALGATKYVKPVWQPKLTHRIDLSLASERNASLARLLTRFDSLCNILDPV